MLKLAVSTMGDFVLRNKLGTQRACRRETEEECTNEHLETHSASSNSDESYCEVLLENPNSQFTLVERQNSENEVKEGMLNTKTLTDTCGNHRLLRPEPEIDLHQCETREYKEDTLLNIDIRDTVNDNSENPNKSKFCSSSDTEWTEPDVFKCKRVLKNSNLSCLMCFILVSFFVSFIVAGCMITVEKVYLSKAYDQRKEVNNFDLKQVREEIYFILFH